MMNKTLVWRGEKIASLSPGGWLWFWEHVSVKGLNWSVPF